MHRFFVPADRIEGETIILSGELAHQLSRVLRCRAGDRIVVLDDTGWEYEVTLTSICSSEARGAVGSRRPAVGEPSTKISLYPALLKGDRFELVLQKCTELGVSRFVPMVCARSVPRHASGEGRLARQLKVITEAAEQAQRGGVPVLEAPLSFEAACDAAEGRAAIPWEEERATSLGAVLRRWKAEGLGGAAVSLFIGPEGGFTAEEVEHARSRHIEPVTCTSSKQVGQKGSL